VAPKTSYHFSVEVLVAIEDWYDEQRPGLGLEF
jgi:hypothetical protein